MKTYTDSAFGSSMFTAIFMAVVFVSILSFPDAAMAQEMDAEGRVKGFFTNINALLNVASLAIVTIAVIFAGYQIAFAHKRMADVAPVLIGGFLIGAAAQLAKMLIPEDPAGPITMTVELLSKFYA